MPAWILGGFIIMKLLTTIDKHILSYWDTAPSERLWAYLATLPVVLVAMNLLAQLIKERNEADETTRQRRATTIGLVA